MRFSIKEINNQAEEEVSKFENSRGVSKDFSDTRKENKAESTEVREEMSI
jgi:hypothetical protein